MSEIHSRELGAIYTRSSAITVCQLFFPLRRYLSQIGHLPVIASVNYQIITGTLSLFCSILTLVLGTVDCTGGSTGLTVGKI